jgi:hypothetical protein
LYGASNSDIRINYPWIAGKSKQVKL